jgi:hypothetical protein
VSLRQWEKIQKMLREMTITSATKFQNIPFTSAKLSAYYKVIHTTGEVVPESVASRKSQNKVSLGNIQ